MKNDENKSNLKIDSFVENRLLGSDVVKKTPEMSDLVKSNVMRGLPVRSFKVV